MTQPAPSDKKLGQSSIGYYFEASKSIASRFGDQVDDTLTTIAGRYIASNPCRDMTLRSFSYRGIPRAKDYRYHANFNEFFDSAQDEDYVFAWAKMFSHGVAELLFDINCYGPVVLYVNGAEAWRSTIFSERYPDKHNRITLGLKDGWNNFVIRAKKTRGGFGWNFGSWLGKHPYVFMMPSQEREGQEGWLFTNPLASATLPLPQIGQAEADTGIDWNPDACWPEAALAKMNCERIFGEPTGDAALGWTKLVNTGNSSAKVSLSGRHGGAVRILCDGSEVFAAEGASDDIQTDFDLETGSHDLIVISTGSNDGWGFELAINGAQTACPCELQGSAKTWLYAGPFDASQVPEPDSLRDFHQTFDTTQGAGYWRLDAPDTWLRIYNETPLFGRWNYPLGVTVYGLLRSGMALESDAIKNYVRDHVKHCCSTYAYSKWDRDQFGGPTHVHRLLSGIDSLDDCGSFAFTMLEVAKHCTVGEFEPIAHFVADYISNQQDRFPDGTFYRREMMHAFHNNTMWADDLYMSVPFLCRYYQLTGDRRYIDDAANQFIGFKKRLYMPEQRIMSHVFDIGRDMPTGVPWGRGNGWTLFSLSELLEVLPEDHEKRDELLNFFREMCEGILALQDDEGMWHQVITHHESYPETSCTSMFAYAFSRGIRFGWLADTSKYADAALKAWKIIGQVSVDTDGNVYGVCRGSEFSFTPDYYINDLTWRLNDTHGIGIVLLAGVEIKKLGEYLDNKAQ